MRPILRPGLQLLRRDDHAVQIGHPADNAAIIEDCPELRAVVRALDGVRRIPEVIEAAVATGVETGTAEATLGALIDLGLIADADELVAAAHMLPDSLRPHVAGDVSSMALAVAPTSSPVELLRHRRQATVEVRGLGPVGACVAWQLALSGLGHLALNDPARVPPVPLVTGATEPLLDRRRDDWLRTELRVVAPWARVRTAALTRPADLVVLSVDAYSDRTEVDRAGADELMRRDIPHLLVSLNGSRAQLGPLVVPGQTPCVRCLDLHRTDQDPAWPALVQQLTSRARYPGPWLAACDRTSASLIGTWAAREALTFVEHRWPMTTHAVLEIWSDGRPPSTHETRWHPACGCDWQTAAG